MEMSKLTRDGTAEPDSRDQTLRRERGQQIINFPCSAADHEQDWQPCPVVRAIHTNIVVLHSVNIPLFVLHVHIIQQQKVNRARMNVCVCFFFPSILYIKFVGRTSRGHTRGRSHRIFHPPSFCGACLNFSREKDSAVPFRRRL